MAAPIYRTVTSSHVAAVSMPSSLRERMEHAKSNWKTKALMACSLVVGLIPFVGVATSYAIDMRSNRIQERDQKAVLADYYRDQIAAQLGVDPKHVNIRDLELAARVNPAIAQAIQKVNDEKKSANRGAAMATAGAAAVTWIPGVNGIANGLAKGAVHMGGAITGGMASSLFDKDVLHVHDMVEYLDEKHAQGQAIMAKDLVMLRIAQNEQWQKAFKKQYKKPFHKMSDVEQEQVVSSMPDMLLGAEKQAEALNRGLISPQSLVMAGAESTSSFADNVQRSQGGSYVANLNAQRELAAQALDRSRAN